MSIPDTPTSPSASVPLESRARQYLPLSAVASEHPKALFIPLPPGHQRIVDSAKQSAPILRLRMAIHVLQGRDGQARRLGLVKKFTLGRQGELALANVPSPASSAKIGWCFDFTFADRLGPGLPADGPLFSRHGAFRGPASSVPDPSTGTLPTRVDPVNRPWYLWYPIGFDG